MRHPRTRKSRSSLCGMAIIAVGLGLAVDADARDLTVVTWGGAQELGYKQAYGEPYEREKGAKITYTTWNGTLSFIRAQVETKSVTNDLYPVNPWDAVAGCDEGTFEKLEPKELGLDTTDFYDGGIEPCGIASDIWTYLLAWNGERTPAWTSKTGPQNIQDMFDLGKFPGKRGLRKRAYATMEYGLWADGVGRKDIYKVLATPEGTKRALAKLAGIKKDIVFLDAVTQMTQALADGEVAYSMILNSRFYNAVVNEKKNFVTTWNDQIYSYHMWVIPKGTPNLKQAKEFIKFALQPERQAALSNAVAYAPARKSALKLVKDDVRGNMATNHFQNELYLDAVFWAERLDSYSKQFSAWLAQ